MNIGLFGGSFDPIHCGHIHPIREAQEALDLDRVYFLPTAHPPHKRRQQLASRWSRYTMVELALLDEPDLFVAETEIEPSTPAYTVETLESFRRVDSSARWTLLMGADSFRQLPQWRRWHDILLLAHIGVLVRPGETLQEVHPHLQKALDGGRVQVVNNQPHPASSTSIRQQLAQGKTLPARWLPPRVLHYIEKYGLYR